jgi:hypothetical protein
MELIIGWAVAFMLAVAPPGPWRGEPREETVARYQAIAVDAVAVAYDPDTPPLFTGPGGRARTVALLLSVAFHESSFRKDVDLGVGPHARGDSGLSWCLMQIQVADGRTIEGFAGPDLVRDRKLCFTTGLAALRRSLLACRANPMAERLSAYTSGSCSRGAEQSRRRIESAMTWLSRHPAPQWQD